MPFDPEEGRHGLEPLGANIFGLTLRGQDLFCQKEYEVTLRSPTKLLTHRDFSRSHSQILLQFLTTEP